MAEGLGGLLPPVVLELIAKTDKLKEGLVEAKAGVEEMASSSGSSLEHFGSMSTGILTAAAGTAIALGVAAIHMADDYEKSHARLETAVKNAGQDMDAFKGKIDATDSQMEKFGFTNADTENALSRLTAATHDVSKATDLMGLAADIARGRNIDLQSATDLLVKVEAGRYTQLTRLGIATADQVKGFKDSAEAVQFLANTFGGDAQARADTFAGKMEALHAKVTDLGAQIGMALIPVVEDLVSRGLGMVEWLQNANTATDGLLGKIGLLAGAGVGATLAVGAIINVVSKLATTVASTVSTLVSFGSSLATFAMMNPEVAGLMAVGAAVAYIAATSGDADDSVKKYADDIRKLGQDATAANLKEVLQGPFAGAQDAASIAADKVANAQAVYQRFLDLLKTAPDVAMMYKAAAEQAGADTSTWGDAIQQAATEAAKGRKATEDWSTAVDDASASLDDGAVSAKEAKAALDDYNQSSKDSQKILDDVTKSLKGEYDALTQNTSSLLDAQNAQIDANAKLQDYGKSLKDTKLSADDHTKALNEMEKQLIDTAQKTADASTANMHFGNEAQGAATKTQTQIQYLQAVANTLEPGSALRNALEGYIGQLNSIKSNIETQINVDTAAAAKKIQDWLSQPRSLTVTVNTVTSRVDPAGQAAQQAQSSGFSLGGGGIQTLTSSSVAPTSGATLNFAGATFVGSSQQDVARWMADILTVYRRNFGPLPATLFS